MAQCLLLTEPFRDSKKHQAAKQNTGQLELKKYFKFLLFFGLKFRVFLAETLNAARSVDQFLFPGEKRVALGTNFNRNILLCRTNFNFIAAGALDGGVVVLGMGIRFHKIIDSLALSVH